MVTNCSDVLGETDMSATTLYKPQQHRGMKPRRLSKVSTRPEQGRPEADVPGGDCSQPLPQLSTVVVSGVP